LCYLVAAIATFRPQASPDQAIRRILLRYGFFAEEA
jgi:hypothetical protein